MKISKDEFQVIELILSLYPDICRAAEQRRDYLISLILAPNHDNAPVQGGSPLPAAERVLEAVDGDKEIANLKIIISRVCSCVSRLRAEERQFVTEYYIKKKDVYDFDESSSVIYSKRRKICSNLAGVLGVYNLVREWRALESERRLEAVKRQGKEAAS